ncbi:hypothetical protein ACFY30_27090 [Streptomyces sp. NPDC000345]|uniref:hypothetical protein n=1 Tax=Streptomyces sp. NPDC000345 TaxID=3364537 RepID=UPI0036A71D48
MLTSTWSPRSHTSAPPRSRFGGLFAAHLAAADARVGAVVVNGAPATPAVPEFRTAAERFGVTVPFTHAESDIVLAPQALTAPETTR